MTTNSSTKGYVRVTNAEGVYVYVKPDATTEEREAVMAKKVAKLARKAAKATKSDTLPVSAMSEEADAEASLVCPS